MKSPLLVLVGLFALATSTTTTFAAAPIELDAQCSCGQALFTSEDIRNARDAAVAAIQHHQTISAFPTAFTNSEGFKFIPAKCGSGPYVQFPLLSGRVYHGGSPNANRIVLHSGTNTFCGCITHIGAHPATSFVQCQK